MGPFFDVHFPRWDGTIGAPAARGPQGKRPQVAVPVVVGGVAAVLLIVVVSALVNVGLGFVLAVYLSRRYQAALVGRAEWLLSTGGPAESGDGPLISPEAADGPLSPEDAATESRPDDALAASSVEILQGQVRQYSKQLTEVETRLRKEGASPQTTENG